MIKHLTIVFLIIVSSFQLSFSQDIVDVEYDSSLSLIITQLLLASLGLTIEVDQDVDIYRVLYTTVGSDMQRDTASGLFMLPADRSEPLPILCYQHGTTEGRSDVPSNLGGAYQLGALFAAKGMAVVAPDFLGMGESRGFHPYVHAETQATAAVDLIRALKTFLENENSQYTNQLFITGYSQGGHAAMGLHEYIQEELSDEMVVTASLPMSGPYDLSGTMLDLAAEDIEFLFPSYIVYSTRGLKEIYPSLYESESQLYKTPYLADIEEFVSTGEGLFDLNQKLVETLIIEEGSSRPGRIFRDSVIQELQSNPDAELIQSLAESDVYNWIPEAPVLMLYCESDDQVPFINSVIADSVMNALGAINVSAEEVSDGQNLDHTQCAIPALNRGVPWLFSFLDTNTSTEEIDIAAGLSVYPTLTTGIINVSAELDIQKLEIYSLSTGQRIYSNQENTDQLQLDISTAPQGFYTIHLLTEAGYSTKKVLLSK